MNLQGLAQKIKETGDVVCFTGAGISTESGVPDFRSPGGLWTRYAPVYFSDFLNSEEARVRAWTMKSEAHELYRNVRPNTGHVFVRTLAERGKLLGLITQNIDGLHTLAGLPEDKTVELHGTDRRVVCLQCGKNFAPEVIFKTLVGVFSSPRCDACHGLLKPATVSFGQPMPYEAMTRARQLIEAARIFLVLGSSLQVHPAASFPVLAKQRGALIAIVNRDPTPLDPMADFTHRGEIGAFCRELSPLIADS
ncbi:MAG TPA: Sir2 family NAD-dependent protein deacetylase [Candidatus Binatia bacterium]